MSSFVRRCSFGTLAVLVLTVIPDPKASAQSPALRRPTLRSTSEADPPLQAPGARELSLDELIDLGLRQNPRLAQASAAIEAARGRAIQAGLYPNPTVGVTFDELGDKTGAKGVNTLPLVSQEIVIGGKLRLSRDAGFREMDQASWERVAQRYAMFAGIRSAYFDALTLQQRIEILDQLLALAEKSVDQTNQLLKAKEVGRLDLIQLEVELERLRADREAADRELPGAYKRLAAVTGVNQLAIGRLSGSLEIPFPDYELERTQDYVLAMHPEVHAACFGVQRARLLVERARIEPLPNVSVDTGYVRQNQNKSDDYRIGANLSVPLWNRNQGNIHAAEAQYRSASQEVRRVENDLTDRVAVAMRDYASARQRAERYRLSILPRARETYDLSLRAYQGGQFEYLRVIEAQRSVAQANLEYVRVLGEAWKAAAVISGLTLEDCWPSAPIDASERRGRAEGDEAEPRPLPDAPPPMPQASTSARSRGLTKRVSYDEAPTPAIESEVPPVAKSKPATKRLPWLTRRTPSPAIEIPPEAYDEPRPTAGMRVYPLPRR